MKKNLMLLMFCFSLFYFISCSNDEKEYAVQVETKKATYGTSTNPQMYSYTAFGIQIDNNIVFDNNIVKLTEGKHNLKFTGYDRSTSYQNLDQKNYEYNINIVSDCILIIHVDKYEIELN